MRGILALAVFCVAAPVLAQEPSRTNESTLNGRVLAADGAALRRTRIEVTTGRTPLDPVLTDDQGRFAVRVEGTGPFSITAIKGGFMVATTAIPRSQIAT